MAEALGLPGARAAGQQLRAVPAEQFADLQGAGLSLALSLIVGDVAMPRPSASAEKAKATATATATRPAWP